MSLFPFLDREDSDDIIATTLIGNEVYSSLVFLEVESETGAEGLLPELDLQDVVMGASKRKNIKETEVQNRPGTVKEYISDGQYKINVRGVLATNQRTVAPLRQAKLLDKHLSLDRALKVGGLFLENLGILSVVILDYDITEIEGVRNNYAIRINMVADNPIELEIGSGTADANNTDITAI